MSNRSGACAAPNPAYLEFCNTLATWIDEHGSVIDGLAGLRDLDGSAAAIDAVLQVKDIKRIRLGWEFWEAMVDGDGLDPEALLLDYLGFDTIEVCRTAFWGVPAPTGRPALRLV